MYHSDTVMRIHTSLVDIIYRSSLPPPPPHTHTHTRTQYRVLTQGWPHKLNLKPDSDGERWKPCMEHLN